MRIFLQKHLQYLWPGAGWLYLLMCLAGLAGGLWPEFLWPVSSYFRPASLPTLQTLALAQILFFTLVWPVAEFRRVEPTPFTGQALGTAGLLFLTVPFYFVAGWLADATLVDCIRTGLIVLAMAPLGWAGGRMLRVQFLRGPVMLGLMVIMLGLPGAYYFLREFYPQISIAWLWRVCPVGLAWCGSVSRETFLFPRPIWTIAAWPMFSVMILLIFHRKLHDSTLFHENAD